MKPLLVAALLLGSSTYGADSNGFVSLFNGRDLTGWVNANCAPETWSVTNGLIHCTGKPTGAMRTTRQYENFILEVEWRHLSSGGNSGVFIWGTPIAAPGVPFLRGIEVQVLDHGYNAKGKNEWYTTHGDVFPIHGAAMKPFGRHNGQRSFPSEERSKGFPEWNHYRIVCMNGTIRLSVNGKEVSGGEDCNYRKGYLALESEGGPVEFRNIRIKELSSNNPPADVVAPQDNGLRSIFTGLDLRGWKENEATKNCWAVEGERLRLKKADGAAGAVLWTEKNFSDPEFIIDVRRPKGVSGVPTIFFGDSAKHAIITLREEALRPEYMRIKVAVKSRQITIEGNGDPYTIDLPEGVSSQGALGLSAATAPLEFMNLYARETRF